MMPVPRGLGIKEDKSALAFKGAELEEGALEYEVHTAQYEEHSNNRKVLTCTARPLPRRGHFAPSALAVAPTTHSAPAVMKVAVNSA